MTVGRRAFLGGFGMGVVGFALGRFVPRQQVELQAAVCDPAPFRPFSATSYWNTPLPPDAPLHPSSADIIDWMYDSSTNTKYISLGPGDLNLPVKGSPVYYPTALDPVYHVTRPDGSDFTSYPEFRAMPIPLEAQPSPTSDAQFNLFDLNKGWVAELWKAVFSGGTWTAQGVAIYYVSSNGLARQLAQSDDRRNGGHRGMPPSSKAAIRKNWIDAGVLPYVVDLFVPQTKAQHVFPYTGDEQGSSATNAPAEGARIRMKASVDISGLALGPKVVAQALKDYGAVVGDRTGGNAFTIQMERRADWGLGWRNALNDIPLTPENFEVIEYGWGV